ncbi:hypothetical protein LA080_016334 [Diaporthe eres]|nr:hypothetical protein LA080_016334 [Diaporthe eres]
MRVKSAGGHDDSPVTTRRYDSLSSSGEFEGLRPADGLRPGSDAKPSWSGLNVCLDLIAKREQTQLTRADLEAWSQERTPAIS